MRYMDYVICKHDKSGKRELYVAPCWSHLKAGDTVLVTANESATVLAALTLEDGDREVLDFVNEATGTGKEPKRLFGKVNVTEFDYSKCEKED